MKALISRSIFIAVMLLMVNLPNAAAQAGAGNSEDAESVVVHELGNQGNDKPVGNAGGRIPIDGGASILLVAGAAYGLKKVRDHYKGKKAEPETN